MRSTGYGDKVGDNMSFDRNQLVACRPSEFRVELEHVDCELNFVDDPLAGSVATAEQFKVRDVILGSNSIDVMDGFVRQQFAPEVSSHDMPMFEHGMFFTGNERRHRDPDVTISFDVPSKFSTREFIQCMLALVLCFTFAIAKLLLRVYVTARFAASTLFFATLHAGESLALHCVLAPAQVRTRHRTIQWVLVEFLAVCGEIRRFIAERFRAFFAGEKYRIDFFRHVDQSFGLATQCK